MSAPEVKVGQRWKRSEWSLPSGWIVKRVKDGVVTLYDPDHKFSEIDRSVDAFSEWILVDDIPRSIVKRVEDGVITLVAVDHERVGLVDEWRPAPLASRWLDPASVPAGRPMRLCAFGERASAAHAHLRCPYPASGPRAHARHEMNPYLWCAAHVIEGSPARLPPSVLTPVPRWRTLSKERLYPSTPRVGTFVTTRVSRASLPEGETEERRRVSRVIDLKKAPRVFCVRAHDDRPGRDPALLAAKWVRA